jgi:hypothetical protein
MAVRLANADGHPTVLRALLTLLAGRRRGGCHEEQRNLWSPDSGRRTFPRGIPDRDNRVWRLIGEPPEPDQWDALDDL